MNHALAATPGRHTAPPQAALRSAAESLLLVTGSDAAPNANSPQSLDPGTVWPAGTLPVPGQTRYRACSVTSVWRGLQLVNGLPDVACFSQAQRRRPGADVLLLPGASSAQFLYGPTPIDAQAASLLIYLPTYLYLLDRVVSLSLIDSILYLLAAGEPIASMASAQRSGNLSSDAPFGHADILTAWFDGSIEETLIAPRRHHIPQQFLARFESTIGVVTNRYEALHGLV